MRKLIFIFIFLIWSNNSYSEEITIYVVSGKQSGLRLSCRDIKFAYLKEKIFSNNIKIIPVNLPANNKLRKLFNRYVLKMDEDELSIYWNQRYYEGITPPLVLKSEKAMRNFLKSVKGSIGYLTKEYLDKSLKILCIIRAKR
ncbi:hypothetical protein [Persephonella sp.]|uniref:hypothetical protein n=1 Tax=Persephonella sp. TaxID=2060922 RepID=UPI0026266024|nr:hypothetical protein [Persephonella sp.]